MRGTDAPGDIRKGLDVPFPDRVDAASADPQGERVSAPR
jgi:hypothetical protein